MGIDSEFISPISDTDIELPIPDHSDIGMNFDIRFRIDQSDINLADMPIFSIIDRYHRNYPDSNIGYRISLEMLVRYWR